MKKITKKTATKKPVKKTSAKKTTPTPAKKSVKKKAVAKIDQTLAKKKVTKKDVADVLNDPSVKKALADRKAKKTAPVKKAKGKTKGQMNDERIIKLLSNTWNAIQYDMPEDTDPRDVVYDYVHTHGQDREAADAFYAFDVNGSEIDYYHRLAFPWAESSVKSAKAAKKKAATPAAKSPKGKPPKKPVRGVDATKPILARVKKDFSAKNYALFEEIALRYGINAALGKLEKTFKDKDFARRQFYYRTGEDLDTFAEKLLNLADKNGITPRAASKFTDIQKELGLGESEITEGLISRAEFFDRTWTKKMRQRVENINGKRKSRGSTAAPKTAPAPTKGKGSKPSSSAPKGRGARVNGMTNKDIAFAEWNKEKATGKDEAERIHSILDGAVQLGSVRGWISAWSKGKNFPASAKN